MSKPARIDWQAVRYHDLAPAVEVEPPMSLDELIEKYGSVYSDDERRAWIARRLREWAGE